MAPSFKRKRVSSAVTGTSRTPSSRPGTSLASFKRPSLTFNAQPQLRRAWTPSQSVSERAAPASQPPPSRNDDQRHVVDEDETDDTLDHVIMAVDMKERGTVGCAYYVAREGRLFCMEDIVHGGKDVVETLKLDIQPTIVLVSLRIDVEAAESSSPRDVRQASLVDEGDDRPPLPYRLDYRPNSEFSYEGAKNKLANLHFMVGNEESIRFLIPGDSLTYDDGLEHDEFGSTSRQGKLLRISGWINLDSKVSVGCVGSVLTYLQRKRAAEFLQDDALAEQAYQITSMEMFSMKGTMFINPDTLLSLQIIQPESHPNAFNQGPGSTGSKESLSIYGLFHHLAHSPQGRARLRQLFLRPSLDLEEIRARFDFVSVFVRQENMISLEKLSKSMSKVKNMRMIVTLLRKGISGGNQKYGGFKSGVWASLLEFAYHTIDIRDTLREVVGGGHLPLLAKAMDLLDVQRLQHIGRAVNDVVDLEASVEQHRTVVKRGINDRLDEVKTVYDGMDDLLSKAAVQITETLPADIEARLNVIYFPQLGYHITVPINADTGRPVYSGGDRPWERMFTTQNQVYFKDDRMRDMDEQLGDLWAMMCDIEIEISYDLAQDVLRDDKLLIAVSDLCGELDCLLALAHGAGRYRLTRPRMTNDNVIDIKAGRHLLQEMTVPMYITNDAFIVGGRGDQHRERSRTIEQDDRMSTASSDTDGPSMVLLTGPNHSGKSVYQKQVALAVYMAHIGSFVPASMAVIGITDKILTRITTRETVSKTQSAFMIDLQQIALALNQATRQSLVVIDEFGKGTDSCDGAGLAAGVFEYLLSLGTSSPKVLAATHFHEIFEHGFLRPRPNLAFAHMEILIDQKDKHREGDTATEVTYLYALRPGRSALSYGTQCAAMNGIPSPVISRAAILSTLACQGEDLVAICAVMSPEEEEDLEDAEVTARAFLEQGFDELASSEDPRSALESVLGESTTGSVISS